MSAPGQVETRTQFSALPSRGAKRNIEGQGQQWVEGGRGMGRIDVVVPDELELRLRIKAVRSHGGRRGSLSDAIQAAIEDYVKVDESAAIVQNLTKTLRDRSASLDVVRGAMKALAEMEEPGLLALTQVVVDPNCPHRETVAEFLPVALRSSRTTTPEPLGPPAEPAGTEAFSVTAPNGSNAPEDEPSNASARRLPAQPGGRGHST